MSESDQNKDEGKTKEEKPKQATPQPAAAQPAAAQPAAAQPAAAQPAAAQPAASPAQKPSPPATPTKITRDPDKRNFFKILLGTGVALSLIPFVPTGVFLIPPPPLGDIGRQRIANVRDLKPNSAKNFIFPKTGVPDKDNDPFRQFILVRLPEDLARQEGKEYKAYSEVCVHLWCLWQYDSTNKMLACPCHGSMYDPVTGIAICGPAALQAPPSDTLPELELEIDNATGEIFGVEIVGELGLGRATDRKPVTELDCLG